MLRKERGLNQGELAKYLGISKSSVGMWETGKRLPSPELFEQLADFFNVDIDYLYGRTNIRQRIRFDEDGNLQRTLRPDESNLLDDYNVLSDIGKNKVTTYTKNLRDVEEAEAFVNAAHERNDIDATEEMLQNDEDIMNDENF